MTRFVHFRNTEKTNGVTVAYEFEGDRDSLKRTVVYGASFCSPKDNFNKKFGRMIAQNRLNSDRGCSSFEVQLTSLKHINIQIICAIRKHLFENGKLPTHSNGIFSLFFPCFGKLDTYTESVFQKLGLTWHEPMDNEDFYETIDSDGSDLEVELFDNA